MSIPVATRAFSTVIVPPAGCVPRADALVPLVQRVVGSVVDDGEPLHDVRRTFKLTPAGTTSPPIVPARAPILGKNFTARVRSLEAIEPRKRAHTSSHSLK